MSTSKEQTVTAFDGDHLIGSGPLAEVALAVKKAGRARQIAIFEDATGRAIDIDTRGSDQDVVERLAQTHPDLVETDAPRGPGRPKLGVVAREVTLLPRHWDWLNAQPGGASVMLRKLVDEARRSDKARLAGARDAAYRFISAMAGNRPHFEDAARALYAGERKTFERMIARWPVDIRNHARKLAADAFADKSASA
ncbi:MAG: DUF2239 family protein [Alphaproteobacteria bacterium]|nr:DUF2239 family protein [Alphaproteobacteria bacterium]